MNYQQRILDLIRSDEQRMRALRAARTLDLPDWLIAAGFIRNLIWSNTFGINAEINDIDLIYFCRLDISEERDRHIEEQLGALEPELPWSVKNQARMHLKNNDSAYQSTFDAMAYWPEKQTSVGVLLDFNDELILEHIFDLDLNFNRQINRNPARSIETFRNRIESKEWLRLWPALQAQN